MNYIVEIKNALSKKMRVQTDLLNLYTLLVLTKGQNVTNKDVHDAWAVYTNTTFSKHKSLVPFEELSLEVQEKDTRFTNAIKEVAKEFNL